MRWIIVFLGVMVVSAILCGCESPMAPVEHHPLATTQANDELSERVAKNPIEVLKEGLDRYDRDVTSYTCTLYKQERLDPQGLMGPRVKMLCKFMEKPYSVFTDAVENPVGARRALYIEGKWDGKLLVQPAGLGMLLGFLLVDPHGPEAKANTLQTIDQFGFKRSVEQMIRGYEMAKKDGILTSRLLGSGTVEGRDVIIYEVNIKEPAPTGRFQFPHIRVSLDRQWLLPIAVDAWDAAGIERGHYRYVDVNFGAHLTAEDFTPEACGMKVPK